MDTLDKIYLKFQQDVASKCKRIDGIRVLDFVSYLKEAIKAGFIEINESGYLPIESYKEQK